jgi:hypothetical protein
MAKQFERPEQGPTHEEIAQRAYTLFEKSGRVPGHDIDNWLQAEAQLMADRKAKPETRQAKPETRQQSNGSTKSSTRQTQLSTRA